MRTVSARRCGVSGWALCVALALGACAENNVSGGDGGGGGGDASLDGSADGGSADDLGSADDDARTDGARPPGDGAVGDASAAFDGDVPGGEICRPEGLAAVLVADLPMTGVQVGNDPRLGAGRIVMGTNGRAAALFDDTGASVSALVASLPSMGDLDVEVERVRRALRVAVRSDGVVGPRLTTHELHAARTMSWIHTAPTSASALRDQFVMELTGAAPPRGGVAVGASGEFIVEATVVRRAVGMTTMRTDVIVAVTPLRSHNDLTTPTAIRVNDLVDATGVAEAGKALGARCQVFRAPPDTKVDFLWTVDTSSSTNDVQRRIGDTAERFITTFRAARVDLRVAVLAAQRVPFDFVRPGLRWISIDDPMAALRLAHAVTTVRYRGDPNDMSAPYPNAGTFDPAEAPIFAAVTAHDQLAAAPPGAPPDLRLREGARVAAFFVADEFGQNDDGGFFQDRARWGESYEARFAAVVRYFQERRILTFGLVNFSGPGLCLPTAERDMRRCVIYQNGGTFANIRDATDEDITLTMSRIVAAVVGGASPYRLDRTPITSTLKVRVRGADVPRSRVDGFDYDAAARAVVFYGPTHRPRADDPVVVSYRVWDGSPG